MFGAIRREVGEIFKELYRRFGIELVMVREYIRTQEEHEKRGADSSQLLR